MPISNRGRIALTLLVAVLVAGVIGVLATMPPEVDRLIAVLPPVPATPAGAAFAALCAVVLLIACLGRLGAAARGRARRRTLEASMPGAVVSSGIRHRALTAALAELGTPVRLPARFAVAADAQGITFWRGGRRPKRVHEIQWREVRAIRADTVIAGSAAVPVALLRIRRDGSSLEVPLILAGERAGAYALVDAPFYATMRAWKAEHRAALAAEGLELPPLTAPIPVITEAMLAGAVR